MVKVTNLKNSKSVVVRINDRGPHGPKTDIIDLSGRAAQDLDMIKDGRAKVKLEVVEVAKKVAGHSAPEPSSRAHSLIIFFHNEENSGVLYRPIEASGFESFLSGPENGSSAKKYPFEVADHVGMDYTHWRFYCVFLLVPAQEYVGKFIATFKEYPPSAKVGSFSLDQVLEKLSSAQSGGK